MPSDWTGQELSGLVRNDQDWSGLVRNEQDWFLPSFVYMNVILGILFVHKIGLFV